MRTAQEFTQDLADQSPDRIASEAPAKTKVAVLPRQDRIRSTPPKRIAKSFPDRIASETPRQEKIAKSRHGRIDIATLPDRIASEGREIKKETRAPIEWTTCLADKTNHPVKRAESQ